MLNRVWLIYSSAARASAINTNRVQSSRSKQVQRQSVCSHGASDLSQSEAVMLIRQRRVWMMWMDETYGH